MILKLLLISSTCAVYDFALVLQTLTNFSSTQFPEPLLIQQFFIAVLGVMLFIDLLILCSFARLSVRPARLRLLRALLA